MVEVERACGSAEVGLLSCSDEGGGRTESVGCPKGLRAAVMSQQCPHPVAEVGLEGGYLVLHALTVDV